MSYRSIKRVLGETSLERKCRFLFGVCLLLLVGGAFWGIDRITSQLVITTARNHCHDLVDIIMIKVHSLYFETEEVEDSQDLRLKREWLQEIMEKFEESQDYKYEIVTLEPQRQLLFIDPVEPQDRREQQLLRELQEKLRLHRAAQVQIQNPPVDAEMTPEQLLGSDPQVVPPVYVERRPEEGDAKEYHYFEAVRFSETCSHCHTRTDTASIAAAEMGSTLAEEPPMLAVKVILPYQPTADAIRNSRAILIAVAILTVFLAMITLYLIVRYVIVKPLKHLRDVSDRSQPRQDWKCGPRSTRTTSSRIWPTRSTACCGT